MRKLSIAVALASTALATPAVARDNTAYVGIEGGIMLVEDFDLDYEDPFLVAEEAFTIDHKYGFDVGVVGGYDFGAIRVEGELAYKRAGIDEVVVGTGFGAPVTGTVDAGGSARAISVMLNALFDFGDDLGLAGYVGGGLGLANVRYNVNSAALDFSQSDRALAWQGIAGIRFPVGTNMEAGLKYRLFSTRRLDFGGRGVGFRPDVDFDFDGKWRSHSLLASLLFNFGAPPPPPVFVPAAPPPPPPPATQTCPDGSVILATDICPAPPPPPPPPPPAPERG